MTNNFGICPKISMMSLMALVAQHIGCIVTLTVDNEVV